MKRKKLILILAVEAVLVCVLMALSKSVQNMNFSILSFPLEPVFLGLKAAANAGPVGNGFAVLIAAVLILLPVFFALRTRGEGIVPECVALLLLAGAIGLGLYGCWNPNAFRHELVGGSQEMESALRVIFSLCILSMLILFIVLTLPKFPFLLSPGGRRPVCGFHYSRTPGNEQKLFATKFVTKSD